VKDMSEQNRVVVVNFGKEEKMTLHTSDPEAMLQAITNKESGWFIHEHYIFRREHVTYAYISSPAPKAKARAVKMNYPGF